MRVFWRRPFRGGPSKGIAVKQDESEDELPKHQDDADAVAPGQGQDGLMRGNKKPWFHGSHGIFLEIVVSHVQMGTKWNVMD